MQGQVLSMPYMTTTTDTDKRGISITLIVLEWKIRYGTVLKTQRSVHVTNAIMQLLCHVPVSI